MKLTLENIGKIKHAEIDLSKDLIVLCGPNNTGKTYVAYLVYGLFNYVWEQNTWITIGDSFTRLPDQSKINLNDYFLENKENFLNFVENGIQGLLPKVFASSSDFFDKSKISISIEDEVIKQVVKNLKFDRSLQANPELNLKWKKEVGSEIVETMMLFSGDVPKPNTFSHGGFFLMIFSKYLLDGIFQRINIAPAERIAINIFSKELSEKRTKLVDELLDSDSGQDALQLVREKATRFSLPIHESLSIAEKMDIYQKEKGPFSHLADTIENDILLGTVKVSEYGDVRFKPNDSEKDMGIHMAGSVVKSLASIVFYLRHIAKPNDFYIIDEPELTLHPDNQRKIARVLVRMMNAGIKIMMSTHSDYIIRELNNLMMLKTDHNPEKVAELMEKYGYKAEELLDHKRVGAYLFTEDVKPLEVTETGFEVKTIDDEIHSLNNSSADIFFSLHD